MPDDVNRLIREFLDPKRVPSEEERQRVIDHVAQAPFAARDVPVDPEIVGKEFGGRTLERYEPSLIAHLAKRVLDEGQWAGDVDTDEYMGHLHSAVKDAESRQVVFVGRDRRLLFGSWPPTGSRLIGWDRTQSSLSLSCIQRIMVQ